MKYKTPKEIQHLNMLEHGTRIEALDLRYQPIVRMVNDKNEKYINFNHNPMIELDSKNLIICYINQMIDIKEFINRMTNIVGYNIMFENLKTQDNEKN